MRGARIEQAVIATLVLAGSLAVFIAVERAVTPRYHILPATERPAPPGNAIGDGCSLRSCSAGTAMPTPAPTA